MATHDARSVSTADPSLSFDERFGTGGASWSDHGGDARTAPEALTATGRGASAFVASGPLTAGADTLAMSLCAATACGGCTPYLLSHGGWGGRCVGFAA